MGISEEVFGSFNKKEEFIPKIIPKDEASQKLILSLIRNSILFQSLDSKDEEIIINAMEEKFVKAGETVIKEGEDGDALFIVAEGEFSCFKVIKGENTFLKKYKYGDAFGELSLMYNAPRAATIIADIDGKMFGLDRATFSNVVKTSATKKR